MIKLKRLLLLQPNMKIATSGRRIVYPPMGIMYLAALLEAEGCTVSIPDSQREAPRGEGYVEVDIPMGEVGARTKEFNDDLAGKSCNFFLMVGSMNETARLVKKILHRAIVVAGGDHPTSMAEEVMKNPAIDFVLKGEAEASFPTLLKAIDGECKGCDDCDCDKDDSAPEDNKKTDKKGSKKESSVFERIKEASRMKAAFNTRGLRTELWDSLERIRNIEKKFFNIARKVSFLCEEA